MRAKTPADPYSLALTWLALRELSEFQVRQRLRARHVSPQTIEDVIGRLRRDGAVDDRRTALAYARTHALVKHHGRSRVMRQLEAIGIRQDVARRVVHEVFEEVDERELMERALTGRMGRRSRIISEPSEYRRLFAYLVRQGFEPSSVHRLLRTRSQGQAQPDEE